MGEQLQGYQALQRRLSAVGNANIGLPIMKRLALGTVREAKLLVPRKTGNLGRSINVVSVTARSARVEAWASYAAYVELGTRAHIIRTRYRRALAWGGARRLTGTLRSGASPEFFATIVHHPGTRPHAYLMPGARKAVASSGMADEIVTAWNSAA